MKNNENDIVEIDPNNIPKHLAFIMDGNGRWATKQGLPRTAGHRAGVDALTRVAEASRDFGVQYVTVYAFSTENYNRSEKECNYIFELTRRFAKSKLKTFLKNDTRFVIFGDLDYSDKLDGETKEALLNLQEATKNCKSHTLNMCFSYGGKHEIVQAVNKLIKAGEREITAEKIARNLYSAGMPDPDMIIRASGEQRLSNFLMWQSAYSELYFCDTYWPDFNKETVKECIIEYQKRNRRFGNVK